jgi:hypothetical protein
MMAILAIIITTIMEVLIARIQAIVNTVQQMDIKRRRHTALTLASVLSCHINNQN